VVAPQPHEVSHQPNNTHGSKDNKTLAAREVPLSERGYNPKPGERSMTKAEYKIQSSAERNFAGKQTGMNCALQSSQQIIRASNGKNLTEAQMIASGTTSANYNPKTGTNANRVPDVLKAEGVKAKNMPNKPTEIQSALAEGKGVISAHDAGKLWGNKATGGHAVHVTSVVKDANGKVTHYVINDTGTGHVGRKVTAAQYEGSLLKAPATVTENPISYGGRTSKEERRKAEKAKKPEDKAGSTTGKDKTESSTPEDKKGSNGKKSEDEVSLGAKKSEDLDETVDRHGKKFSKVIKDKGHEERYKKDKETYFRDRLESGKIVEDLAVPKVEAHYSGQDRELWQSVHLQAKDKDGKNVGGQQSELDFIAFSNKASLPPEIVSVKLNGQQVEPSKDLKKLDNFYNLNISDGGSLKQDARDRFKSPVYRNAENFVVKYTDVKTGEVKEIPLSEFRGKIPEPPMNSDSKRHDVKVIGIAPDDTLKATSSSIKLGIDQKPLLEKITGSIDKELGINE
jgi:hypothetical protein